MLFSSETSVPNKCSARGCQAVSGFLIKWRNPKIHTADREKIWLACDAHLDYLREFLELRRFPVRVVPATDTENPSVKHERALDNKNHNKTANTTKTNGFR